MAVPTIPSAISLGHIRVEFYSAGSNTNININGYYAGGANVPSGTTNATSVAIPSSGQIAFSNFSGAVSQLPAQIYIRTASATNFGKGSANAYMRWLTTGSCQGAGMSTYTWLNSGTSSTYKIRQTRTGGTYATLSGMTNLTYYTVSTTVTGYLLSPALGGTRTYQATVDVAYVANSVVIDSNTCNWYAKTEYTGCPTCCFTPNTLITMADGTQKPIIDVKVGDEIRTNNGDKKVTEVLIRENMRVFRIIFNDEYEVNATDDHPFYVLDKGWASINPCGEYKDIGFPHKLELGDCVVAEDGGEHKVTFIEEVWYPYRVYTFAETEFYANGLLVY